VLRDSPARPLVFVAIDEGFAPINSLIEHAIAVDASESITLYWASAQAGGQYLPNQCRAWAEALDEFSYKALASDELPAELAANPALAQSEVYLAGSADTVEPLAAALLAAGVPAAQLHVEGL
jgi:CDP-4-dehydro-6-deoxyglucose reductase